MTQLWRDPFRESTVNEAFRRVRNRLRKHYPEEIILACVSKLNEQPSDKMRHLVMYPPWRLLLLVKWALLHGDYVSPDRRLLEVNDFNYLLNLMHDLEGKLRLPSEYDNAFLFFRNMAFQQFWLQREFNMVSFGRQGMLFGALDNSHPFQKTFADKSGVTIQQFLELAMMLMTRFVVQKKMSVTTSWFSSVAHNYEAGTIERFLSLLSGDIESLRNKLAQTRQSSSKVSYEVYEKTPLRETPLLKHGSEYYPFSPQLLARSLETFLYDTLRSDDPGAFMDRFGSIFERYVGNSLSNTGIPFLRERDLARAIPSQGKLIDYVLVDKDSNVFIDAKGVEMSYLGMVGHRPELIEHRTRDSIIKGIEQGFEVVKRLEGIDKIGGIPIGKTDNYLIIVTFKDLFVGNGRDFHNYVAQDTLDGLVSKYGAIAPIPFDHMYFMSVDDFDMLAGAIASQPIRLVEAIDHALRADSEPATKKFTFGQHLQDICPALESPKWLRDECEAILARCALRFSAG